MYKEVLKHKISSKEAIITVIGLGHVGFPLADLFHRKGFTVIGVDINEEVVNRVSKHFSTSGSKHSYATTDGVSATEKSDFIIICVPTPIDEERRPVLSFLIDAAKTISRGLDKGKFVILESTVYPGTTEEVLKSILEESGLRAGVDFGLAYSPNRINPGSGSWPLEKIPKVIAGINSDSTEVALRLYGEIIEAELIPVSSIKTAEAVKLTENIFRWVNIALVNELSLIFGKMGIDTFEVINAAKTKPFGFIPHYPGIGIGGSCIPVSPFYLQHKAEELGMRSKFIDLAAEINNLMINHTINILEEKLRSFGRKLSESIICILGVAYKPELNVTTHSPAIELIKNLMGKAEEVRFFDPYVNSILVDGQKIHGYKNMYECMKGTDALILATAHSIFLKELSSSRVIKETMRTPIVIDGRGALNGEKYERDGIAYVRIGGKY